MLSLSLLQTNTKLLWLWSHYLSQAGPDGSGNMVDLCPNHHRIVHATDARFNRKNVGL